MNQNQRLALVEQAIVELTRPKNRWQRFWSGVNWFGVVAGVPSSVASLVLLYLPQVNINLDKTLNTHDAFATQFAVVNGSALSIHDVHFRCNFNIPPTILNNQSEPEIPTDELNAGDTLVRGCGIVTKDLNLNATLDTIVDYKYFPTFLGDRHVSAHFEARRDTQGVWQWFKTIQTSPRLSVQ